MSPRPVIWFSAVALLVTFASPVLAGPPRYSIYLDMLAPSDRAAREFARPGFGLGVDLTLPVDAMQGMLAYIGGIEFANLLAKEVDLRDSNTGLRVKQKTDQTYGRLFLGGSLGPHGNGTVQPYADLTLALIIYDFSTTLVIPNDSDPQNPLTQTLRSRTKLASGWSAGAGLNLNFGRWGLDGGVRFLKQYGMPQQLGEGSVTIQPSYLQARFGVSIPIRGR